MTGISVVMIIKLVFFFISETSNFLSSTDLSRGKMKFQEIPTSSHFITGQVCVPIFYISHTGPCD